jgi:hypothetical protein
VRKASSPMVHAKRRMHISLRDSVRLRGLNVEWNYGDAREKARLYVFGRLVRPLARDVRPLSRSALALMAQTGHR